jgi:hypothetical protein
MYNRYSAWNLSRDKRNSIVSKGLEPIEFLQNLITYLMFKKHARKFRGSDDCDFDLIQCGKLMEDINDESGVVSKN